MKFRRISRVLSIEVIEDMNEKKQKLKHICVNALNWKSNLRIVRGVALVGRRLDQTKQVLVTFLWMRSETMQPNIYRVNLLYAPFAYLPETTMMMTTMMML